MFETSESQQLPSTLILMNEELEHGDVVEVEGHDGGVEVGQEAVNKTTDSVEVAGQNVRVRRHIWIVNEVKAHKC